MCFKHLVGLFFISLLLYSCENQLETETATYNCYGNLSTPQVALVGTNDFLFDNGTPSTTSDDYYGSTYYFTLDFNSDCMLDNFSQLSLRLELYNGDALMSTIPINYTFENLNENGNIINGGVGIHFGSADRAVLYFKMANLLGNEVSMEIVKHEGAN